MPAGYFHEKPCTGTGDRLDCHGKMADEFLKTAHWHWEDRASSIEGCENGFHGQKDIIDTFCIAVSSNEGCGTACNAGYGWAEKELRLRGPWRRRVPRLPRPDGAYKKAANEAGLPEGGPRKPAEGGAERR